MNAPAAFPGEFLDAAGLNRQHVFQIAGLPNEVLAPLELGTHDAQLILIGHAGRRLWECLGESGTPGQDPIDDYTVSTVRQWFAEHLPDHRYRIVYPGSGHIGLQQLGTLAGWHHPSPFMVGIDHHWGSWFAYRCAVLTDTCFPPTIPAERNSPCINCAGQPCIAACPAGATGDSFDLIACADERLRPASACALGCLARQACPVGTQHRYDEAQIRHSYSRSLTMLENWRLMG